MLERSVIHLFLLNLPFELMTYIVKLAGKNDIFVQYIIICCLDNQISVLQLKDCCAVRHCDW